VRLSIRPPIHMISPYGSSRQCSGIEWRREMVPEHVLKAKVMREFHYLHPRDKRDKLIAVPDALLI